MKKLFFFLLLLGTISGQSQNSVGIGTSTPAASALLDISSTTKGLLAPRMGTALRLGIANPAKGLLVYDTDLNALYHYNGSTWAAVGAGGGLTLPYTASENLNTNVFQITNSGAGTAITGVTTNEFGRGVAGFANGALAYGIYGYTNQVDAVAIYGEAGNGTALKGYSVGGLGLDARSTNNTAIKASILLGANTNPVILATHPGSGTALDASSVSGTTIKGLSGSGVGVRGESSNGTGMIAYSNTNVGISAGTLGGTAVLASAIGGTALKGNSSSGYALDISGNVKIAGGNTSPALGAVLTSIDASGNAVWKANRVGFSVMGPNINYQSIPNGVWRRVHFAASTGTYDATNSFNILIGTPTDISSTFTAPVTGIYHFDAAADLSVFILLDAPEVTSGNLVLKKNSNGTITDLVSVDNGVIYNDENISSISMQFSKDVFLNAGERVYLEVRQYNKDSKALLLGGPSNTYFNGHLVFAQ